MQRDNPLPMIAKFDYFYVGSCNAGEQLHQAEWKVGAQDVHGPPL